MGIAPGVRDPEGARARRPGARRTIDVWEVHEAYASVRRSRSCASCRSQLDGFEVPDERLNPNGGAVAIGHPFGSSGTRYVLTLATELRLREARYGVLGVCVGSGPGRRARAREPVGLSRRGAHLTGGGMPCAVAASAGSHLQTEQA